MALGSILGRMETFTKESGRLVSGMDKDVICLLLETLILVNIHTAKLMAMASIDGKMVTFTLANLLMERNKDKATGRKKMERILLTNTKVTIKMT